MEYEGAFALTKKSHRFFYFFRQIFLGFSAGCFEQQAQ